ncbi:MAG: hypothetical protein ACRC4S_00250 [Cetobacterium sp.]
MKKSYKFMIVALFLLALGGCKNIPKEQKEYKSPTGQQIQEQRDDQDLEHLVIPEDEKTPEKRVREERL